MTDLIADIGGTNLRFALVEAGQIVREAILPWPQPVSITVAAHAFLQGAQPRRAALAVAAQVTGADELHMPNVGGGYTFSHTALQAELKLSDLIIVNDFTAIALALPQLTADDKVQIGDGQPKIGKPIGVLGAGTGLGVSGLIPSAEGYVPLTGEGGHITMGPMNAREAVVLDILRQRFGHVSAERVCSGMGLENLYSALREADGLPPHTRSAAAITTNGDDALCDEAVELFCCLLGTTASNLALTIGAFGGIYVAGGIVPKILPRFMRSGFRARFTNKGRYRDYLAAIPTYVVTHPNPAYLGLISKLA